jgi:hypothetical protein
MMRFGKRNTAIGSVEDNELQQLQQLQQQPREELQHAEITSTGQRDQLEGRQRKRAREPIVRLIV